MITSILISIFTWLLSILLYFLPNWSPYPQALTDGIQYFFSSFSKLNFIFPIDSLYNALILIIQFEVLYYSVKLFLSILHFFRGSGKIEV